MASSTVESEHKEYSYQEETGKPVSHSAARLIDLNIRRSVLDSASRIIANRNFPHPTTEDFGRVRSGLASHATRPLLRPRKINVHRLG